MKRLLGLVLFISFTVISFSVHAALVTWAFSGSINSVSNFSPPDSITSIASGDIFNGSMVFNTSTAGTLSSFPAFDETTYSNAIDSLNFTIGTFNFSGPNSSDSVLSPGETSHIKVRQDTSGFTSDSISHNAGFSGMLDGLAPDFVGLNLIMPFGSPLTTGDLLDTPPVSDLQFVIRFKNSNGDITAQMNGSGSISAVPIPAAAWLFGTGLLGLIGFNARKKKA
ncbi:MAG: VPLPA-CTERM sorting domain-containing protein [Candidatus Thiodiazotropha sp. (ex Ctena orbiculata)]|uniref:VPLPA-CTERM sorting domain-containing protein n=1 Tax=Candidatus Thiodiazotropha taylori TaxID=2792791 RepID=A0A944QVF6_9GAMM|nr:VPLPA-CTERM sorting domain-containing protein [Candidatus Thiodiazotropha taylori]PUB85121.1 MAG: hypothetical protein DBP00_13485 [gamma proteobacterium symbiont of Ctena orbiculata]MBT2989371.1 VPLPA-CTERM sorting domain-containing protein [Candidatus Thiodiazotropha taylori]MBT2996951.1 VPLPA-CTERM sorting domain-containing protein [Candidatus Thiodiazotropha taylori]MBT3000806.1 VPLPA-CTERM sorting domain-containing protein [Candidatus Thiodiazotropha taylori]